MRESVERACKAVVFDVASGDGTVGGIGLSKKGVSAPSEGVSESFVTIVCFSTLEGIARRQADEKVVGTRMGDEGEGTVRNPPKDEMFGQEVAPKERTGYYPSVSKKFAKGAFRDESAYSFGSQSSNQKFQCGSDYPICSGCRIGSVVGVVQYDRRFAVEGKRGQWSPCYDFTLYCREVTIPERCRVVYG